jgi:hypothetical protein
MSRVTAPLLSLGAKGTFGKAITFSNWKGISTARLKSNPSNPQTTDQMHARALFAGGGKISKASDSVETLATYLKTITPAEQSWISYFVKEMLGAGNVNIESAITAYELVGNATVKGYFDDASTQAGIESVDLDGTANTQVTAGSLLWAAYTAAYRLGSTDAIVVVTGASEANVFAFTNALTGVTPV